MAGLSLALLFGCADGRLSEEEYLTQARQHLAQGSIEDAINAYKSIVAYYPESEKIEEHRSRLLDLTIQAAEKFAGTPKEETYIAEAMRLGKDSGDTLVYWVKYRVAKKTLQSDPSKAEELFEEIPVKGYYFAAQMALGGGDYRGANDAYERLLKLYPDDEENYKALFLMGFNYSEYLNDYDKARMYFERVLDEYPDCDLTTSAKWMLDNMGKSPDEIEFIFDDELQVELAE